MEHSSTATIIGSAGVSLLLLAFFLNIVRVLRTDGYAYITLNLIGAVLAGLSSYLIAFWPFVVLEGTWGLVAAVALARKASARGMRSPGAGV